MIRASLGRVLRWFIDAAEDADRQRARVANAQERKTQDQQERERRLLLTAYGHGYQPVGSGPIGPPPSGGSSAWAVEKGGQNRGSSQVTERPPAPRPMRSAYSSDLT